MSKFKDQPPEYFPTRQAAQYLGVSMGYLASARCRGDGPPYIKMGYAVRYHRLTLERWMAEREHNPGASAPSNGSRTTQIPRKEKRGPLHDSTI
jgi:hypothetical protein